MYEYKILKFYICSQENMTATEDTLNNLAAEGWKVISSGYNGNDYFLVTVLQRKKSNKEYKIEVLHKITNEVWQAAVESRLNELAEEGWSVIAVSTEEHDQYFNVTLERSK